MRQDAVRELEDWVERTFAVERAVDRTEVLRRAKDADLPREEMEMLSRLPQAAQTPHEIVDEIDRMAAYREPGGSAGGTEAGSSGESRPGAYGAPPAKKYGGTEGDSYMP